MSALRPCPDGDWYTERQPNLVCEPVPSGPGYCCTDAPADACPICLEELNFPLRLRSCGHALCARCIQEWYQVTPSCPVDRVPVQEADVYPRGFHHHREAAALAQQLLQAQADMAVAQRQVDASATASWQERSWLMRQLRDAEREVRELGVLLEIEQDCIDDLA